MYLSFSGSTDCLGQFDVKFHGCSIGKRQGDPNKSNRNVQTMQRLRIEAEHEAFYMLTMWRVRNSNTYAIRGISDGIDV
jgi:hypothetical protein